MTPPLLAAKGVALNESPSAVPTPMLDLSGFSLGAAPAIPDAKSTAEEATKLAAPATASSLFARIKPGAFSLMPKPEPSTEAPSAPDSKFMSGSPFGTKPSAVSAATPKVPLVPLVPGSGSAFGNLPGVIPGATAPAMSMTVAPSLVTPPKDIAPEEPMHTMQVEFTNLYTEVGSELAKVR